MQKNFSPGQDGKDDPFLNPYLGWETPKITPRALKPEDTTGSSMKKPPPMLSDQALAFKIRNDTNTQTVNRSNLQ